MQQGDAGNAAALADALGVTERTVYRDLEVLVDLGVPCHFDEAAGGYRVRRDFFLPPVQLTACEALAVITLCDGVGGGDQIALTGPASQAVEKIKAQLPDRVRAEIGGLDGQVDVRLPATGPAGEAIRDAFAVVREAIRIRRVLRCRYDSLNPESGEDAFDLRPYALSFDQRAWYAVGWHGGREEVRRLKLNRFTALRLTDRPYAIPDDFSMDSFRGRAWRMVRGDGIVRRIVIDFTPTVAETVSDTNWHRSQEIEEHSDGSITAKWEVEGLDEIVWWVLGYGPHAHVREPAELAEQVAELARATAERYVRPRTADRC